MFHQLIQLMVDHNKFRMEMENYDHFDVVVHAIRLFVHQVPIEKSKFVKLNLETNFLQLLLMVMLNFADVD